MAELNVVAVLAYSANFVTVFFTTIGFKPKYYIESIIIFSVNMKEKARERTGVSYAIQAMIFGQRGAFLSGRVFTNSRSESAASRPPILNVKCSA